MQYRDVQLRGIPVVTRGGQKLGKLAAFVIDAAHHEVAQYVISRSSLLSALLPDELLVSRDQVVSLDNEQMVVDDGVLTEKSAAKAQQVPGAAHITPAAMSSIEEMLRTQKTPAP